VVNQGVGSQVQVYERREIEFQAPCSDSPALSPQNLASLSRCDFLLGFRC